MIPPALQALDREGARRRIEEILARDEFRHGGSELAKWIESRIDRAADWLRDLLGIRSLASARLAVYVLAGLVAIALAWTVVQFVRSRRASRADGEGGEGETSAAALRAANALALRREAAAASGRGELLAALRLYFRALVIGLSERGELRYRDGWTNRELLERGAPRPDVLPLLAPLVPRLDAQSFGREPALPEDVERLAGLCDRLLGASSP